MAVVDALGRKVVVLWDGPLPAAPLPLDAGALPAGVYRDRVAGAVVWRTQTVVR